MSDNNSELIATLTPHAQSLASYDAYWSNKFQFSYLYKIDLFSLPLKTHEPHSTNGEKDVWASVSFSQDGKTYTFILPLTSLKSYFFSNPNGRASFPIFVNGKHSELLDLSLQGYGKVESSGNVFLNASIQKRPLQWASFYDSNNLAYNLEAPEMHDYHGEDVALGNAPDSFSVPIILNPNEPSIINSACHEGGHCPDDWTLQFGTVDIDTQLNVQKSLIEIYEKSERSRFETERKQLRLNLIMSSLFLIGSGTTLSWLEAKFHQDQK